MTTDTHDPFHIESGLIDDVDVTFTQCRFGVNPEYTDGDGKMRTLFLTTLVYADGEKDEQFTVGKNLVVSDKGAKALREDGSRGGFMRSTQMANLLAAALADNDEAMRARFEENGLEPTDAGYWEGFSCHVVQAEYSKDVKYTLEELKAKEELAEKIGTRLALTKVNGWVSTNGSSASSAKAPAKKAAKKVAKKAAPVLEVVEGGVSDDIKGQIRQIADESEEFETFVERAYAEVEGADSEPAIAELIDDDGPESIWQAAVDAATAE